MLKKRYSLILLGLLFVFPSTILAGGGSSTGGGGSLDSGGLSACTSAVGVACNRARSPHRLYVSTKTDFSNKKLVPGYTDTSAEAIRDYLNSTYANSGECTSNSCITGMKQLLAMFGISDDADNDNCEKFNGHLYFAITAPVSVYGVGRFYDYTAKEVAQYCRAGRYPFTNCRHMVWSTVAEYLYITGRTSSGTKYDFENANGIKTRDNIARERSGYGVFEVWVDKDRVCEPPVIVVEPPKIEDKCITKQIRTRQITPICSATEEGTATVREEVVSNSNSTIYGNEKYSYSQGGAYGVETYDIGSYCTIYCTEEATVTLPKGFVNPVVLGSNIVWPTSKETKSAGRLNDKPLKLSGKKTCRVDVAPNSKNCSNLETNYSNMVNYVKKQSTAKDYAKKTYEQVRKAIENKYKRLSEPSDCTPYYASALSSAKTQRRKTNVINSRTNCEYYIKEFNYIRLITDQVSTCDSYSKAAATNDLKNIYNFNVSGKVQNEDVEYNKHIDLAEETKPSYNMNFSCISGTNCWNKAGIKNKTQVNNISDFYSKSTLQSFISHIENRKINISTNTSTYQLPKGLYNYINKKTNKATSTKPTNAPFTIVGYSNLPISLDAKTGVKTNVNLKDLRFGHNGKFNLNYSCTYEVTNSLCVCPEGTLNAGQDLTCKLSDMTCIEAQETYCNSEIYDSTEICDEEIERYQCKNTNKVGGKMDITSCVLTRMQQGSTKQEAIDYCDMVVCPLGIPIIYRVISLENPFPGKDIANRVPGFNLTVVGRYPGTNWNSQKLVTTEILNNRSVKSDSIYKKEPLYVFDLNAKTVKSIRAYNEKAADGYSDFTLECNKSSDDIKAGTNCISKKFVHDSTYGLSGGTCQNVTSTANLKDCANK